MNPKCMTIRANVLNPHRNEGCLLLSPGIIAGVEKEKQPKTMILTDFFIFIN